jgi:curved DNA-binding protein
MDNKNYYDVLNVTKDSTIEEIKKSYRKLSMKYHPDKNNGEDTKMKKITEAYTILGDSNKKKQYDLESSMLNPNDIINMFFSQAGNMNGVNMNGVNMNGVNMGTHTFHIPTQHNFPFFNANMFTNNFIRPLVHKVHVTLEEIYNNSVIKTTITKTVTANNTKRTIHEEISVTVPSTYLDSNSVILKHKGHIINNNKGDLKIKFILVDHKNFSLYNNDIIYSHTICLKDALCGFSFNIDYLNGKSYKINNSDTIINHSFKKEINNMGLLSNGVKGKLIIMFNILFPNELSKETKQQLKTLL